jgi:hypothetical protein
VIKWSFSGLKQFINCPKQYNEIKVLQNYSVSVTEQMRYGTEVHKALEDYVRDRTPLAKNYERFGPVVDALLEAPGVRHAELELALRKDSTPCDFRDPDYWVRGIIDLLILNGSTAYIVDYKTGSAKYPDAKQLKLMALMTFAHFPEVNYIKAGLLFLAHDVFIDEAYRREDIDRLWSAFAPDVARLETSSVVNVWPANPTPLCGWCPVDTCEYYKPRRRA